MFVLKPRCIITTNNRGTPILIHNDVNILVLFPSIYIFSRTYQSYSYSYQDMINKLHINSLYNQLLNSDMYSQIVTSPIVNMHEYLSLTESFWHLAYQNSVISDHHNKTTYFSPWQLVHCFSLLTIIIGVRSKISVFILETIYLYIFGTQRDTSDSLMKIVERLLGMDTLEWGTFIRIWQGVGVESFSEHKFVIA